MTDMTIEELKSLEYTAAKTVGNTTDFSCDSLQIGPYMRSTEPAGDYLRV